MNIDCLDLTQAANSNARGRAHGEHYRTKIRELYEIRRELALGRSDFGTERVLLDVAALHLPLAHSFDRALFEELEGLSEGSGLSLEELVVLNHYTDLRDLGKAELDDGGCSTLFKKTSTGNILGQTWDMHGSATDYVALLDIEDDGVKTVVFTIVGCVGMTGLNGHGLGMTINNLNSTDAVVGIIWPILVRRCLREESAINAKAVLENAPIGSGHHYIVADDKDVFGVETSGTIKKVIQQGSDGVHLHTNHALDADVAKKTRVMPTSTTHARYEKLCALKLENIDSAAALYREFGAVSNAQDPEAPHGVATCGAFVMDLRQARALACKGPPTFPGVVASEHRTRESE